jgi:small subunit ribosomal protein S17
MGDTAERKKRKALRGVVRRISGTKTISVLVSRRLRHPLYGKYVTLSKGYLAHDEKGEAAVGDTVEILSARPLSARKRWRLARVLRRGAGATETLP